MNGCTYLNLSHVRVFVHGQLDVPNQHMTQRMTVKISREKKEKSLPSGGVKPGLLKLFGSPITGMKMFATVIIIENNTLFIDRDE